jgi:hypothetical protein
MTALRPFQCAYLHILLHYGHSTADEVWLQYVYLLTRGSDVMARINGIGLAQSSHDLCTAAGC